MIQSKLEKKYNNFKISRFCNQILMIAMILIITGCSTKSVKLEFKADPDTNNGQPLCILLRSVNTSQFLTEGYNDVAGIVYSIPVDPSVIDSYLILPDKKLKVKMKIIKDEEAAISVYGLFSDPDQWKIMLPVPLKSKYKFIVKKNSMVLQ